MSGWIKVHRKMIEWEWYHDINVMRLFIHLLIKANFKDKKWQGMNVQRGQLITSRDNLAKETGLTSQQIRTCLDKLKSTGEITIKTTNKFTVVTIENFTVYQDGYEENNQQNNQQPNQQVTNKQPTNNQQITTTKERKERKNEKNIYSSKKPKSKNSFHNIPERDHPDNLNDLLRQKGRDR